MKDEFSGRLPEPGLSQVDLARRVHVQPPTLVRREMDTEDRRTNRMYLTAKGATVVERLAASHDEEMRDVHSVLTRKEQQELCALMGRLSDRYESMLGECAE